MVLGMRDGLKNRVILLHNTQEERLTEAMVRCGRRTLGRDRFSSKHWVSIGTATNRSMYLKMILWG